MSEINEKVKIGEVTNKRVITAAELAYLCYFAVMLGAKAVGLYEGQMLYNICLVIGAALFACKIALTKHNIVEYLIIVLLMALGAVVYLQSGEKSLLIYFTMMLGIKGVSTDRLFKVGGAIWLTSFVTLYVLSVVGIIPEFSFSLLREGWPIILRHSLGYPHPNTLHASYFVLVAFLLYLTRNLSKKYIVAISVVLLLGNGYVFMYSVSRNGFLMVCIYLFLHLYLYLRSKRTKIEDFMLMALLPLGIIAIVGIPLLTTGDVFEWINTTLAGRYEYTRYYLTHEPLKLFGIESIAVPDSRFVIDSSYVYLIFRLGIVSFILMLVLMVAALYDAIKNDRKAEISLLISFYLYGVLELFLFNQSFKNLTFVFMGLFIFKKTARFDSKAISVLNLDKFKISLPFGKTEKTPIIPLNIWLCSAILLVLIGVITSLLYVAIVPYPSDIYLPRSEEKTSGDGIETYLTSEQVKELKKTGVMIRGYVDETTPVYRMQSSSVAKMERIRYTFSYGLWAGAIACLIFLFTWTAKSRLRHIKRNKTIGPDYKETVLIVHNYYRIPGGEDVVVANEKRMLEEHGHKVVTYFRNNDDVKEGGFWHKLALAFSTIFNIRTYRNICRIIEKEKVDIVHVHNTVAIISPAVYIAGINMDVPVVQTVHNMRFVCPNGVCYINDHVCENCIKYGLKASLVHNCYRNSKLQTMAMVMTMNLHRMIRTYSYLNFICLTDFNKEKLMTIKQINPDNVFIKPNFTRQEHSFVPYDKRKNQIVYAGRLEKKKGVDLLLQAWMKLGDKAPRLILCGSGELEGWCKEYIENNELTTVEMKGQVPNDEAKKIIGDSLAMIHPTQLYEGFPMTIAESYSMGTPIIASDIGNVGSLVDEGISGIKFKSNSVVSMAKAVETFMEKPIHLPEEYLTKYSEENNYLMLKTIYETVRKNGN
ncbi:glycosyltransferase family 4 protein [Butyrivibrio sp. YAB3001]|uniref:glycosyltransferase family 4 protein n=1 Tax=Butyrivibrio sp. YAB3001 TaxID=1520812 RepID=UPI0008F670C2|nr:glycosyltransferase family 4 protein [Butyrivibrio sp. YAB3001]SFC74968.1 Glycosyltransferase involved in cell wall bisynthesis [Butyrivibrio sp. YAB3001]